MTSGDLGWPWGLTKHAHMSWKGLRVYLFVILEWFQQHSSKPACKYFPHWLIMERTMTWQWPDLTWLKKNRYMQVSDIQASYPRSSKSIRRQLWPWRDSEPFRSYSHVMWPTDLTWPAPAKKKNPPPYAHWSCRQGPKVWAVLRRWISRQLSLEGSMRRWFGQYCYKKALTS